ncbi:winged helix-turn-helix domain-containing protein [Sciscionella sediminilitoris]|uniref:winged helix-turn-helix domain-containing protein n=1 Tax=Sciscionella sediminilitoris TaxID=1445613 RepID=UPI0004DFCA8F|nr:transcriptional regulator [Sciscionella sp. SE31]
MTASPGRTPGLDRLLSDPTRLAIMSVLGSVDWCDFAFLRDSVSLSDSALSKQLTTLKNDGQVEQRRTYFGRVPKTTVRSTEEGRARFLRHVEALRTIAEQTPRPVSRGDSSPHGEN